MFKALADKTRRRILDLIREEPLTTGALCLMLEPLDRCTVMLHLKVLEQADLVVAVKRGRSRLNVLNAAPLVRIKERWLGQFSGSAAGLVTQLSLDTQPSRVPK